MLAGHCVIQDFVILGGGAGVHQFVRIGQHAFIGGMSAIENDVIPYGMAIGNRAHSRPQHHRTAPPWFHARPDP